MNLKGNLVVPAPLQKACNSPLYCYDSNMYLNSLNRYIWPNTIIESNLSPACRSVLQVAVCYMARIGEVLSLKVKHIVDPDRVVCHGSKGSNGYVMMLPCLTDQVAEWKDATKDTPLFSPTYSQVYRGCIKALIYFNDGEGRNVQKCHAHRYLFAQESIDNIGKEGVKIALHHKSIKSQEAYTSSMGSPKAKRVAQTRLPL